jgi:hypothetical protein
MDVPGAVARNIFFYAVDVGVDENTGRLLPFDPTPPLRHIENMPLRGPDRRLQLPVEWLYLRGLTVASHLGDGHVE